MAHFIMDSLRLCFYCRIILHIAIFRGPTYEIVQNPKTIMACDQCAGVCEVVVNVRHSFSVGQKSQ